MTAPTKTPRVDALIAACASGQELPICALSDFEDADNKLDRGDVNQVGNIIGLARTLETELAADELRRNLQDPVLVHANMLRGTIAKLSMAQQLHLVGADEYNALADELARRVGEAVEIRARQPRTWPATHCSIPAIIARVRAEMEKERGNG